MLHSVALSLILGVALLSASVFADEGASAPGAQVEAQAEASEPIPHSINYTFDASTTKQVTQTLNTSYGVSDRVSLIGQGTVVTQLQVNPLYNGSLGVEWKTDKLLTVRLTAAATASEGEPTTFGGSLLMTWTLSQLWGAQRYTRVITGAAYSDVPNLQTSYALGLDPSVLQMPDTLGVVQELFSGWEVSLTYAYYAASNDPSRDSLTAATQIQITDRSLLTLSGATLSQPGTDVRNVSGTLGLTFYSDPIRSTGKRMSVGIHSSVFQYQGTVPTAGSVPTATGIQAFGLRADTTADSSTNPPSQIGYSGGIDLGFYW